MNERIKELAKQSGMDIYGLGLDRIKWEDTVEEFAELIVKECADVAEESAIGETIYGWMVANRIKRHFGVK
jgi:hypothetical protein